MNSVASQVLERHLDLFQNKDILFNGFLSDEFPWQIEAQAKRILVSSAYYDYVMRMQKLGRTVEFAMLTALQAELIVFYWSKNKAENHFQLMHLLSNAEIGQQLLIVGENRSGVRAVEKALADYGDVRKIDSARRCSLFYFQLTQKPQFDLAKYWHIYHHPCLNDLQIHSLPGVFSAHELDEGTRILIDTFTQYPLHGKVLDIGCGAGVIGSSIVHQNPDIELCLTDIDAMAIASTQHTLQVNNLSGKVIASDVYSDIDTGGKKFDFIISNPPFHDGLDTDYHAAERLIFGAASHLTENGELRIVANAFLPYRDMLEKAFGKVRLATKTKKFKVYRGIKG